MTSLRTLLSICEQADVIGIGEHHHGDLLSWKWRIAITKHLINKGYNVIVLLEQLQINVDGLSQSQRPHFIFQTIDHQHGKAKIFYPHMLPSAVGKEHMKITKEFAKMNIEMYGTDIALLRYDGLINFVKDEFMKQKLLQHKAAWNKHPKVHRMSDGMLRNTFNAKIIKSIMCEKKTYNPNTKILYFAHNEHVAVNCESHRTDPKYMTEGQILKGMFTNKYVAIGTYAPNMSSLWSFPDMYTEHTNRKVKQQVINDLQGKKYKIYDNNVVSLELDDYNNTDFDSLIVQSSIKSPTPF